MLTKNGLRQPQPVVATLGQLEFRFGRRETFQEMEARGGEVSGPLADAEFPDCPGGEEAIVGPKQAFAIRGEGGFGMASWLHEERVFTQSRARQTTHNLSDGGRK